MKDMLIPPVQSTTAPPRPTPRRRRTIAKPPGSQPRGSTTAEPSVTPDRLMQLGAAFTASKAFLSAVELGVFTELAKGPLTATDLTHRLGLHPRSARDFFDTLVALELLERKDGTYRNRPDTGQYLDRAKPEYLGGILEMANARLYGYWGHLTEGLRTGKPQNEARHGGEPFAALYGTPERMEAFLRSMTGLSLPAAHAIASKFPWNQYRTFADVGAAQGAIPVTLARQHPHLRGLGFDLPVVQPVFERYVRQHGLQDRIEFQAGDFFADPLPATDVLLMGHILHDWDMDQKRTLLRKAWESLPTGGALIIFEALIDDDRRENRFGLLMSLNMLIETPGGFDFTGADCQRWMRDAGFRETRVEHLVGPDSMVVAIK